MHFQTQRFLPAMSALAFLALFPTQTASAQTVVYNNTGTATSGIVFNGSTNHGGNTLTNMNADDLTLAPGSGGLTATHFLYEAANFGTTATRARPSIFFWANNENGSDPGGDPGAYLGGITLTDTLFAAQQVTPLSSNITFTIPANGKIWAGIVYDDDFGTTGATPTQLDALGGQTYGPPSVGSSGVGGVYASLSSYTGVNNPVVTYGTGNVPVAFGWKLEAVATPEPGSFALLITCTLGLGFFSCRTSKMRRTTKKTAGATYTISTSKSA